jgi:hypothetical protein
MMNVKKGDMMFYWICIFFMTFNSVLAVESNQKTAKRDYYGEVERFEQIYLLLRNTMLVAFAPIVFRLLYSLYRDPATPLLWKAMVDALKKKFGNLSDGGMSGRAESNKEDYSTSDDPMSDSDGSY